MKSNNDCQCAKINKQKENISIFNAESILDYHIIKNLIERTSFLNKGNEKVVNLEILESLLN